MRVAVGGHSLPLLIRVGEPVRAVGTRGSLVGVLDDATFADEELELVPGDVLVLRTDGVDEARASGREFGEDRLRDLLEGSRGLSADEVAGRIEAEVMRFSEGMPRDDTAILVLEVTTDAGGRPTEEKQNVL